MGVLETMSKWTNPEEWERLRNAASCPCTQECVKVRDELSGALQAAVVMLIIDIADHRNLERTGGEINNHYGFRRSAGAGKPTRALDEPEGRRINTRNTTRSWWI